MPYFDITLLKLYYSPHDTRLYAVCSGCSQPAYCSPSPKGRIARNLELQAFDFSRESLTDCSIVKIFLKPPASLSRVVSLGLE